MEQSKTRIIIGATLALAVAIFFGVDALIGQDARRLWAPDIWENRADSYRATIQRDLYGVPHIVGRRDVDVAFALAWTQAQDALEDLEESMRSIKGMAGRHYGTRGVRTDYLLAATDTRKLAEQALAGGNGLSDEVKAYIQAFADGLNYFAARNPEKVDPILYPIEPVDIVAHIHFHHLVRSGITDQIESLSKGEVFKPDPLGLNYGGSVFAVAPSKGWGSTQLLINPHSDTEGTYAHYEAHLFSQEGLAIAGGTFPGNPFILFGFREELGWGTTLNRGLQSARYSIEIDPSNPARYRMDGIWRAVKRGAVHIADRWFGFANFYWTSEVTLEYTEHGLLFRNDDGNGVALRYDGMEQALAAEQWYRMNKAEDFQQWKQALKLRHVTGLNFVYADRNGDIAFFHATALRQRDERHDWWEEVPGNDRALINLEAVLFDDIPQAVNPTSGFLVSAGQSAWDVTSGVDRPEPSSIPMSWGADLTVTNRGLRALELFNRPGSLTAETLRSVKFDGEYSRRWPPVRELERLLRAEIYDTYEQNAQSMLANWDLKVESDSSEATLGVCLLQRYDGALRMLNGTYRDGLSEDELLLHFNGCVEELDRAYGRIDLAYGEVNSLKRGSETWPLNGGYDTLRDVKVGVLNGQRQMTHGDSLILHVEWDRSRQVSAHAVQPYGVSRVSGSAHYKDQAPLFATQTLREVLLDNKLLRSQALLVEQLPSNTAGAQDLLTGD